MNIGQNFGIKSNIQTLDVKHKLTRKFEIMSMILKLEIWKHYNTQFGSPFYLLGLNKITFNSPSPNLM